MESITDTHFDLVIAGTGLTQSLLALALSRAKLKVLHLDKNAYYGGPDAALSLQDAEEWATQVNERSSSNFFDAAISAREEANSESPSPGSTLAFSRSYSIALSPQILYSRSTLLPTLVSSKVYRQLEFLAVGSWWIYDRSSAIDASDRSAQTLRKIPGSREDVFADSSIDLRSKRSLMKFLKFITDPEAFLEALEAHGSLSFDEFLTKEYNIQKSLQPVLHALTLSYAPAYETPTSYALPRILRHLSSIGVFGPGFGAVVPKWGGLAEVAQVACRALAVGGGIYMLGHGIRDTADPDAEDDSTLHLSSSEQVKTRWKTGCEEDFPNPRLPKPMDTVVTRSISIISSPLSSIFPSIADGAPPSACSVVAIPPGSVANNDNNLPLPIYLMAHTSETGECPSGQCVVYASIKLAGAEASRWLEKAVTSFLECCDSNANVLWSLAYSQRSNSEVTPSFTDPKLSIHGHTIIFSDPSVDLAFDDRVLREVRTAWQRITGNADGFMEFQDREVGEYDDDE